MTSTFTKARTMTFPRQITVGHNVIEQVGEMCQNFGLQGNALIVTGPKTKKIAGGITKDLLADAGYNVQFAEVGEATKENVEKVRKIAYETKVNFLLGVGGGSKIDIAKLVATQLKKPLISVPTSASHDGIASPRASIKDNNDSISLKANIPSGVVADTSIILKAPYRLLASGCADVIANLTAVLDWDLARRLRNEEFSTSAATLGKLSANTIIEKADAIKPNLEESVWIAIRPIIVSGISMSVANSSRPASGSEHLFSHALENISPGTSLHGERCGVGAIMVMYLHGGDWERIRNVLKKIGAPTTAKELHVTREQIVEALTTAHKIREDRYTILGDKGLNVESAEQLASITGVA